MATSPGRAGARPAAPAWGPSSRAPGGAARARWIMATACMSATGSPVSPDRRPDRSAPRGIGGFDESFIRYGGEDTEFAWRAQVRGAVLVPERGAFGWHQGRWAEGREGKARDLALQADTLAGLIAEPGFRPAAGGRFAVPRHVVTLDAGRDAGDQVIDAAHILLADPADDVGLCLEIPPRRGGDQTRQRLEQAFGEHPRVRIVPTGAALEAFPASPLHLALPVVPAR